LSKSFRSLRLLLSPTNREFCLGVSAFSEPNTAKRAHAVILLSESVGYERCIRSVYIDFSAVVTFPRLNVRWHSHLIEQAGVGRLGTDAPHLTYSRHQLDSTVLIFYRDKLPGQMLPVPQWEAPAFWPSRV